MPSQPKDVFEEFNIRNAVKRQKVIITSLKNVNRGIGECITKLESGIVTVQEYEIYVTSHLQALHKELGKIVDMAERNTKYIGAMEVERMVKPDESLR